MTAKKTETIQTGSPEEITVTWGTDYQFVKGTATVPFRLTSVTLTVDGVTPSLRKGDSVPTLRLTDAQLVALRAAGRGVFEAGSVILPRSAGRGRPRKGGMDESGLDEFFAS